jgi:hypothetical protein
VRDPETVGMTGNLGCMSRFRARCDTYLEMAAPDLDLIVWNESQFMILQMLTRVSNLIGVVSEHKGGINTFRGKFSRKREGKCPVCRILHLVWDSIEVHTIN